MKKTAIKIDFKAFVLSYLATASWVTCDSGENNEFTRDAKKQAEHDCEAFINMVIDEMGEYMAEALLTKEGNDLQYLAAHDFFLTRNHHGAGFWDKEDIYGEANAATLTALSHKMKEVDCTHIRGKKSKLTFC